MYYVRAEGKKILELGAPLYSSFDLFKSEGPFFPGFFPPGNPRPIVGHGNVRDYARIFDFDRSRNAHESFSSLPCYNCSLFASGLSPVYFPPFGRERLHPLVLAFLSLVSIAKAPFSLGHHQHRKAGTKTTTFLHKDKKVFLLFGLISGTFLSWHCPQV